MHRDDPLDRAAAALLNKVESVELAQRARGRQRTGPDPVYGWMQNIAGARQFKPELEHFRRLWHAELRRHGTKPRKTARIGDLLEDAAQSGFVWRRPEQLTLFNPTGRSLTLMLGILGLVLLLPRISARGLTP